MTKKITIALAGNPNCGKTTIFNDLTGARQHVGNYPGVTVEKKEGNLKYKGYEIKVVDITGIYSLTAYSIDEIVARNFIVEEKPDVVIDIVDTSNLERNLYLAVQFMELKIPLIIALNMADIAEKQGLKIDKEELSKILRVPLIFTVATKSKGLNELLDEVIKIVEIKSQPGESTIKYGEEVEKELDKLENILIQDKELTKDYPSKWLALKLLEGDAEVTKRVEESLYFEKVITQVEESTTHLKKVFGDSPEAIIADRRYGYISGACREAVKKSPEERQILSDKIDQLLVNRVLGLPILLTVMWLVFNFVFKVSAPLMGCVEMGQTWLGNLFSGLLPVGSAIQSLIVDGIIGGVGSVLIFVPIIFLLFLAMAFLEDTGYMARAVFIMDKIMHKIGLHGRSFIPMLLGFGCTIPAIMATRTIEDKNDRFVTMLVVPFISCGARLPVYALLIGAFFPERISGNILFSLYILGIVVAIFMAKILRKYLFRGEAAPFVMELPPYRFPTVKGLLIHMWERGVVYLKKAGTIIFVGVLIVWFLSNFPWSPNYSKDYGALIEQSQNNEEMVVQLENERAFEKLEMSYAGKMGRAIAPIFKPLGFDDWKLSVGLIGGFVAKEIVVGTLGTLHSVGEVGEGSESLRQRLQSQTRPDGGKKFNPLVAYTIMIFVLLYIPCVATIAVIKRETNSWKWPIFTVFYTTGVAWIASFIVYQGGRLLGLG
jgi:ferrous iron transport protein B